MGPDFGAKLFGSQCRVASIRLITGGWSGTIGELSRRTGFSVRSVTSEVALLASLGLVTVSSPGGADLIQPNENSPLFAPLKALLSAPHAVAPTHADDEVRESLVGLGAPLAGVTAARHFSAEETVVQALRLAREDGTVLRVLPLVLAKNELKLDWAALKELARRQKLKSELGLLTSLAAKLTGRPSLAARVVELRDGRRTKLRYFPEAKSKFERALAEQRSPRIARHWGFLMNVSEDSLRSTLSKHGA